MIYTFDSTQPGAPVLSGTAGALATLLKICLVDGFGAAAASSLVVTAGVAKATFPGPHPYKVGTVMRVAGATPSALNGDKVVSAITSTSASFAAPGVADGAATGTISAKAAPAGWQEQFAGTSHVLVLKSTAAEATGCFLRIDDAGTLNARVRLFEAMSDASTGTGPTPTDVQSSGGLYWPKSDSASAAARPWLVISDGRALLLAVAPTQDKYTLFFAGDFRPVASVDAYAAAISGNLADQSSTNAVPDGCCGFSHRNARSGMYVMRSHSTIGGAVGAGRLGAAHNGTGADVYSGASGYSFAAYPNGPNNGLLAGTVELWVQGLRGTLPGLLHVRNTVTSDVSAGIAVDGTDDMLGRRLLLLRVGPPTGGNSGGYVLLDQTGPWQ